MPTSRGSLLSSPSQDRRWAGVSTLLACVAADQSGLLWRQRAIPSATLDKSLHLIVKPFSIVRERPVSNAGLEPARPKKKRQDAQRRMRRPPPDQDDSADNYALGSKER